MSQVQILLVDDHEVVRLGLKSLLERHAQFNVVAEAASESEAVAQAIAHEPDVVLMDVRLAGGNGVDACAQIMMNLPQTKIIILTSYAEDDTLFAAIRAGAVGYVLKQVGSAELVRAIESAVRGEATLDPSLTQKIFSEMRRSMQREEASAFDELTNQEMQVLSLIAEGSTNRHIAESLYLSEGTVRNYVSSILSKLGVSNRAEAAAYSRPIFYQGLHSRAFHAQ
jgi:DNA-binding NarL/FixJ family response regulator